jgi:hypothetical protein
MEMQQYADLTPSPARSMPYDSDPWVDFHQHCRVVMPEKWDNDIPPTHIVCFGMSFDNSYHNVGAVVHCDYRYMRAVHDIEAEETASIISLHNQMSQHIGIVIFDTPAGAFDPHPLALWLAEATLLGSGALALLV